MCNCNYSIWADIIPAWLTAIGTIGAVLVALFLKPILKRRNKPIISLETGSKEPFVETLETKTSSSDADSIMKIRVLVKNDGIYAADDAALIVDSWLKQREDGNYVKIPISPRRLNEINGENTNYIAHNLLYYYDVAVIQKCDEMGAVDANGHAKQNYKLNLMGGKQFRILGKGTFIIPIKFFSSQTPVIVKNLKIFWNSDNFVTDIEHFDISMIDDKDFNVVEK